jgi:hypothetical protein
MRGGKKLYAVLYMVMQTATADSPLLVCHTTNLGIMNNTARDISMAEVCSTDWCHFRASSIVLRIIVFISAVCLLLRTAGSLHLKMSATEEYAS